jgi:hypothetical protein
MFSSLCRKWFSRHPRYSRRRRPAPERCRLRLEALEDRCVPSGYTFTTFDVPGSTFTIAGGVNASGQVVGAYGNGGTHGFLRSGGSYTTLDVPGSTFTNAFGINDSGQVVGGYVAGGLVS